MEFLLYILKFLRKISLWVLLGTFVMTLLAIYLTRNTQRIYTVEATVFAAEQSNYTLEGELFGNNLRASSGMIDNFMSIILAETTLKKVSYRLYARNMIHGDLKKDNQYITAADFKEIYYRTVNSPDGKALLSLIDKTSEDKTLQNIINYEKPNKDNFIYGLFYWNHPHYSYNALRNIKVNRKGASDLLNISYSSNDPGIAYNTLDILMEEFANEYKNIRYGQTDKVLEYFRGELSRIGHELRMAEDSLTRYNIEKSVINYADETKEIASINKEFELREQDVLLAYQSSKAMKEELEKRMDYNTRQLLNNISFVNKLREASNLTGKISELESFNNATNKNDNTIDRYKNQLNKTTQELSNIADRYVENKQSKEGVAKTSIVEQWLEQTLAYEKAKASLDVIQKSKEELKDKYAFYAPVGSTLKRKERNINFTEANYLSLLQSYNTALMRKKNLEMTSASLKVLNPPAYPIQPEASNRKKIVIGTFAGSILLIIGFFLFVELLDRTLQDKIRTERLTGHKLLGAFPLMPKGRSKSYGKAYNLIATRYLSSTILRYFTGRKPNLPYIVNFLSIESKSGKTYITSQLDEYWQNLGLKVKRLNWETDLNINSSHFLLAQSIKDVCQSEGEDILIVEYPCLEDYNVSNHLINEANINIIMLRADKAWKENNKIILEKIKSQAKDSPLNLYLNKAETSVVENFTGMLPPYNKYRKLQYRLRNLGLTEKDA